RIAVLAETLASPSRRCAQPSSCAWPAQTHLRPSRRPPETETWAETSTRSALEHLHEFGGEDVLLLPGFLDPFAGLSALRVRDEALVQPAVPVGGVLGACPHGVKGRDDLGPGVGLERGAEACLEARLQAVHPVRMRLLRLPGRCLVGGLAAPGVVDLNPLPDDLLRRRAVVCAQVAKVCGAGVGQP
ncbi:MAG: hypothetical protein ACK55I_30300, partial [bacterium]